MFANMIHGWNELSIYRKVFRVVLVALIVFAGWAASPLFYNRTVNEAFPAAAPTAPAVLDQPAATAMMADQAGATMADEPAATAMMADQAGATMADEPAATAVPAGPLALQTGSFVDGMLPGHHAQGMATIYRVEDGKQLLRLQSFAATNGPDLFVTFHTGANPEKDQGDYFQIAPLKGNRGDQNYELPADFDLGKYKSVVIWCRTFNVVFGYATLQPAA